MKPPGRLTRRTELARSQKPMKRGRLRKVSAKTRALKAMTDPQRKAYVEEMRTCAVKPRKLAIECHEIAGGADRQKAIKEPATWLAVSRPGHDIVQYESKARQLARKLLVDPDNFDLDKFNAVYTGKESPVSLADVVRHLQLVDHSGR